MPVTGIRQQEIEQEERERVKGNWGVGGGVEERESK